jgi:signal transduction histidine kinase
MANETVHRFPVYEDISTLLSGYFSAEEWDSYIPERYATYYYGDVVIFRHDFLVLYSELPDYSPGDYVPVENILSLLASQQSVLFEIGEEETKAYLLIKLDNKSVQVVLDNKYFSYLSFAFIGIVGLFAICMSIVIARNITRSVKVLENATRRIAEGELDLKVDVKGSNEIISLANSFNKMRNALKEEERRRHFFIMGVTHDLKTPLALIKANVEAIEDGIAANPEEQKHSLNIINHKTDELEGMINSLLDFVRIGSDKTGRNVCKINLRPFLSSYIERVAADAELLYHKVESNINIPASVSVEMDSALVQRALDNIVNNCFRYTPPGTCLFFRAVTDGPVVKLTISDNGNGINEADLPYVFDLFYRGSASRGEQGMGKGRVFVLALNNYCIKIGTI